MGEKDNTKSDELPTYYDKQHNEQKFRSNTREDWPIWVIAGVTFLTGIISILSMLFIRFRNVPGLLDFVLPYGTYHISRLLTLAFGFAFIYLSFQIFRRMKTAWWIIVIMSILSLIIHFNHWVYWKTDVSIIILLILLMVFKNKFTSSSSSKSIKTGINFVLLSILIAIAYGTIGFWLLDKRDFGINFGLIDSVTRTLREYLLMGNPDLIPKTMHASWFLVSLSVMGFVTLLFVIYSLFKPLRYALITHPEEKKLAAEIINEHGESALDYFKTKDDMAFFFSSDKNAFVSYKVEMGVAVCLGDPVGSRKEIAKLLKEFIVFCEDNGLKIALHSASEDKLPIYKALKFNQIKIGEDAIVDTNKFVTTTVKNKEFRRIQQNFEKGNFRVIRYDPPHSHDLLDSLNVVSNEWLSLPGRRERTFTTGQFRRDHINTTPVYCLRNEEGKLLAFVNQVPSHAKKEATIDLMRHRVDIPNGAMDYLFSEMIVDLNARDYEWFNLSMAPLAGVGEEPGASPEEQTIQYVTSRLNKIFSFKGLKKYKSKFDPRWENKYFVYQGKRLGLIQSIMALVRIVQK